MVNNSYVKLLTDRLTDKQTNVGWYNTLLGGGSNDDVQQSASV